MKVLHTYVYNKLILVISKRIARKIRNDIMHFHMTIFVTYDHFALIVDYEPICATESSSYYRGIRESIVCFTVVVACAMDKIFVECVITKSEKNREKRQYI